MELLPKRTIDFFDLPHIVTEKVLGYLTFEELATLRIVCRRFDSINQMLLNKGFRQVEKYQAKCLREVKSQLPRRESERRSHPLFRHCDILTAIETRLSLLNMTFMKYVDSRMCCFIPGKVIDEIYRVLRFIQSHKTLPRSHEILTELRDISSMAMEHFEEKIVRSLKPLTPTPPRFSLSSSFASRSSSPGTSAASPSLNKSHFLPSSSEDFSDLAASNKYYKIYVSALKKEVFEMKSKVNELRRKMSDQEKVALEQNRVISEQTVKLTGQETKLAEFSRKLMEYDQRFNELLGGGAHNKDKQSGSSSSTINNNKWGRDNSSQQFYVTHGLPTTTISSAVLVPANVIQPNLVNLAAAPMPTSGYLPSSSLTGLSSASPGQESSPVLSHKINARARHCVQGPLPRCSTPLSQTSSQVDNRSLPGSTTSSEEESSNKLQCKKRRKRKLLDEDGNNDSHSKQAKL